VIQITQLNARAITIGLPCVVLILPPEFELLESREKYGLARSRNRRAGSAYVKSAHFTSTLMNSRALAAHSCSDLPQSMLSNNAVEEALDVDIEHPVARNADVLS
jgi:hypothetical protein